MNYRSLSAPAGQSAMHNLMVLSNSCRCVSLDSSVSITAVNILQAGNINHATVNSPFPSPTKIHDDNSITQIISRIHGSCSNPTTYGQSPDDEATEQDCYELSRWACRDNFSKLVVASSGGIQAILRAMRTYPESSGVQECCCFTLSNLCSNGSSISNARTVHELGGIHAIATAMMQHPTSVVVQTAACQTLQSLSTQIEMLCDGETISCLMHALTHAKDMYIPNQASAVTLLSVSLKKALLRQRC